ncbi:MAG: DsbA family protein [Chitinophagaceae bacterium]|nr:MAG: DsbA family protein [Chitinophagaceae bacterium]
MVIHEIVYYTDPLCCWSWGMESSLNAIAERLGKKVRWRYCMCGLIPDWKHFVDPVNSVQRPAQMGPVWMHAQAVSGATFDSTIWFRDPPSSSYPACIAVKCVELQDALYVPTFLNLLRKAGMSNAINISKQDELIKLARELKHSFPLFDHNVFKQDLVNGRGREAFRADLSEVQSRGINRFPSLLIRSDKEPVLLTGYRSLEQLSAFLKIDCVISEEESCSNNVSA